MAYLAFANVARLAAGESVLDHRALGGFAAAFPGIARQLGASRVVGTVRPGKLAAAAVTRLPYDQIVDSSQLPDVLAGETFDVIIDARPVRPGSACRLAAFPPTGLPAGRPPGDGADRGVGLQQGPRRPGRRIAALGG